MKICDSKCTLYYCIILQNMKPRKNYYYYYNYILGCFILKYYLYIFPTIIVLYIVYMCILHYFCYDFFLFGFSQKFSR